jgi:hypothetical protein
MTSSKTMLANENNRVPEIAAASLQSHRPSLVGINTMPFKKCATTAFYCSIPRQTRAFGMVYVTVLLRFQEYQVKPVDTERSIN